MALSDSDLPKLVELLDQIDIRLQVRRKDAADWVTSNEVLLNGEWGQEDDTGKIKRGDGVTPWNALAYFGGSASIASISQTAHGFSVLDCLYHDGSGWQLAQADNITTTALCVVVSIIDVDRFLICFTGRIEVPAHGLSVGQWYYLSSTTAGGLSVTVPSAISQPMLYVESVTLLVIVQYRPAIGAPPFAPEDIPALSTVGFNSVRVLSASSINLSTEGDLDWYSLEARKRAGRRVLQFERSLASSAALSGWGISAASFAANDRAQNLASGSLVNGVFSSMSAGQGFLLSFAMRKGLNVARLYISAAASFEAIASIVGSTSTATSGVISGGGANRVFEFTFDCVWENQVGILEFIKRGSTGNIGFGFFTLGTV